jgi:hypothetical protein
MGEAFVVAVIEGRRGAHDDFGFDLLAHDQDPSHE